VQAMRFIDVYGNDYGRVIILPKDATLRVVLEENPSTGYRWQVEEADNGCLRMVSNEFVANNAHAIGAPGMVVFYFKPVRPGFCPLDLKRWRPWEGDKSVVERFRIAVSIISG